MDGTFYQKQEWWGVCSVFCIIVREQKVIYWYHKLFKTKSNPDRKFSLIYVNYGFLESLLNYWLRNLKVCPSNRHCLETPGPGLGQGVVTGWSGLSSGHSSCSVVSEMWPLCHYYYWETITLILVSVKLCTFQTRTNKQTLIARAV